MTTKLPLKSAKRAVFGSHDPFEVVFIGVVFAAIVVAVALVSAIIIEMFVRDFMLAVTIVGWITVAIVIVIGLGRFAIARGWVP